MSNDNWTNVPAGTINAAQQRLWVALGPCANLVANRMKMDRGFVEEVACFAIHGSITPSDSQQRARKIMGANYFGVGEANRYLGVSPTAAEVEVLSEVPFSDDVLRASKDTHVLVAVFPMSILSIGRVQGTRLQLSEHRGQLFATDKGNIGWHLVSKTPVAGSTSRRYAAQQELLEEDEEVPSARVMTYTTIGHSLSTGERLFKDVFVRTASVTSRNDRISVSFICEPLLHVGNYWDDNECPNVGLASAKKI